MGVDHGDAVVQAPLLRDLTDRIGEMAIQVGGIRRAAETYSEASARMGVKGIDEYRQEFEKKAIGKVEEFSKLEPMGLFEKEVLEKVTINKKRMEQRTEVILKRMRRRVRGDLEDEEDQEIYYSESDNGSDDE